MKTKQILYSVALAATMVACSQEELTIPASDTQDLSNRPLLGDITLVDATAETRFATGSGAQPVFADGDKVGAAIIDKWDGTYNKNAETNYSVVEYYSSNSAFTRVNGAWRLNADMPLVEGNYLFYAPYNAAMNTRGPLTVKVPAQQNASTEKAALDQFYKSGAVVRVGYKFLASENGVAQKPSLTLNDVFAYPMITVKNNFNGYLLNKAGTGWSTYNGDLKVDSIQLQVVNAANVAQYVAIGGQLSHANVKNMMKKNGKWYTTPMQNYTDDILVATANRLYNSASGTAGQPSAKDRTPGNITTLIANRTIAKGGSETFYCVMPALSVDGTINRLKANIYVTINDKQYVMSTATINLDPSNNQVSSITLDETGTAFASAVGSINLIKGQKYPQEELNFENGALSAKSSAGNIMTIDLVGGLTNPRTGKAQIAQEVTADAAATVIENNEQFINYFKDQLNGSALTEGVSTSGTNFKFSNKTTAQINSDLIEALSKYNNKGSITINTALVIANDVKATIGAASAGYTPVTFKSKNDVVYVVKLKTTGGGYTVAGGVLTSGNNKSVHVTSGAFNITTNFTVGNLRNDGTINVTTGSLIPTSFVNNNVLNVTTQVNNTITNNGVINILAKTASATVNAGTGMITVAYNNRTANVNVIGGTQEGVCIGTFDAASVKEAEKIAWINAYRADNSGSIAVAAFNQAVLDEMKDIKTVYATGATFPAGVFDMDAKTLKLTGTLAGITGAGIATTTVSNIVIWNYTTSNVQLSEIAASGIYSGKVTGAGKILANGTSATWNGAQAK